MRARSARKCWSRPCGAIRRGIWSATRKWPHEGGIVSSVTLGAATPPAFSERIWRINWGIVLVLTAIAGIGVVALYSAAGGRCDPWAAKHAIRYGGAGRAADRGADPSQSVVGACLANLYRGDAAADGGRRDRQDRHGRATLADAGADADPTFGDRQGRGDPRAGALLSRADA